MQKVILQSFEIILPEVILYAHFILGTCLGHYIVSVQLSCTNLLLSSNMQVCKKQYGN